MAGVSNGQALAVTDWRDGGNLNQGEQEKWLVMPSKIGQMKNCTAYLRLPGDYPATFVNYRHWLPKWYRLWPRLARFKPIQDTPPRDPRFKVIKVILAEGQDALASVRAETEWEKAEAARAEAASRQLKARAYGC